MMKYTIRGSEEKLLLAFKEDKTLENSTLNAAEHWTCVHFLFDFWREEKSGEKREVYWEGKVCLSAFDYQVYWKYLLFFSAVSKMKFYVVSRFMRSRTLRDTVFQQFHSSFPLILSILLVY